MAKSFDALVKRTTTKATRARAARRTRELLLDLVLSEVRGLAGVSQRELAEALGIKQPSLSKLEHQRDMQISTLRRIVEALGGELRIVAKFPGRTIRVRQFDKTGAQRPAGRNRTRSAA
jgi:transcriptional regulator with XRE-family HTH domain